MNNGAQFSSNMHTNFRWVDGSVFDYVAWSQNEPSDDYDQEKCGQMFAYNGRSSSFCLPKEDHLNGYFCSSASIWTHECACIMNLLNKLVEIKR